MNLLRHIMILFVACIPLFGNAQRSRVKAITNDTLSIKERISIHTNALDWALLTPNIGIEFDLSDMDWGRNTIMLSGKFNPNTSQTFKPSWVYNRAEVKGEFRHYFRTEPGGRNVFKRAKDDTIHYKFIEQIQSLFSKKRINPRYWRAYYWGAYASYGNYSIKLGKEGKQGNYYSVGGSFGFGIPLYAYENGTIDFEMGGSVGLLFNKYDVYTYDAESDCYPRIPEKAKDLHILPMVTDLHVSFVWRFHSIKNKYKAVNQERIERKQAEAAARIERRDSIDAANELKKAAKQAIKDSLMNVKKLRKDSIIAAASLKDPLKNSGIEVKADKKTKVSKAQKPKKEKKSKKNNKIKAILPEDEMNSNNSATKKEEDEE